MDSLHRDRFDVVVGIDPKVDPPNGGGHRTCESRHASQQLPGATEKSSCSWAGLEDEKADLEDPAKN